MPENQEPAEIGLAEAIAEVRAELEQAIKEGKNSKIGFRAGSVELDFEVGFTKTRGIDGGLRLSVLSLGGKGERSSAATHRVKVVLTPVSRDSRKGDMKVPQTRLSYEDGQFIWTTEADDNDGPRPGPIVVTPMADKTGFLVTPARATSARSEPSRR
jgi:Trypsin-co-occurring domain 2